MTRYLKSIYSKIFHYDAVRKLKRELDGEDTVLDLGCGWNSPLQYCTVKESLGVDTYDHYLRLSGQKGIHSDYLKRDISELQLQTNSFDVVLCSQVLEHLSKKEGYQILEKMEGWARKKIIVTTPNGFLPKPSYDGNENQEHLSGWTVEDLRRLGFKVRGSSGFNIIRQKCKPTMFWRAVFNMTSLFTPYLPQYAFQLFAVKNIPEEKQD